MEEMFEIKSFSSGLNEYVSESLMTTDEALVSTNCNIDDGSLKSIKDVEVALELGNKIINAMPFYTNTKNYLVVSTAGGGLRIFDNSDYISMLSDVVSDNRMDSINFEYNGQKVLVCVSSHDDPVVIHESGDTILSRRLKNRRKIYDEKSGELTGYSDGNGVIHPTEDTITTLAPKGNFLELHYDRLWIAGDNVNPDRLYFSTAGVNGADIEDFTAPIEEAEANMHGGFIDVRSYDGGKIIGLKVVFNALVIFKNKSAYKIFGNNPGNYELVQLFSSNGAIADRSICTGDNGAYFLNNDGIYFYDGTNTNLISQKVSKTIREMNKDYASLSCACYYDNKYYLAIPHGSSTTNNKLIVYDVLTKSFVIHELGGFLELYEYNNILQGTVDSKIVHLYKGSNNLPLRWETANYDFGSLNSRKNSSYMYFRGKGNGTVRFTVITDKKTKSLDVQLNGTEALYKKKLKNKGKLFKIIIENLNNSEIEITKPSLFAELDID